MKYIYELSKENLKLAKAEVLAVLQLDSNKSQQKTYSLQSNLLFTSRFTAPDRLAYTKALYKFLGTDINKIQWNKHYKTNFRVRAKGMNEKAIADKIWPKLKNPKVNLKNPKTKIVVLNKKYYCLELYKNKENYEQRKSQNRPEPHPSSLHPKLARAMVNLGGAKKGSVILDPFCGSGGILIEASLIGMKPVGFDIDKIQIKRAKINLKHYKVKAKLEQKDALTIKKKYKYIVTDLPYGRSTKVKDVNKLLKDFLNNIKAETIVIGLPNFIKLPKSKYKIKQHFTQYLHKSLSKYIFVLK